MLYEVITHSWVSEPSPSRSSNGSRLGGADRAATGNEGGNDQEKPKVSSHHRTHHRPQGDKRHEKVKGIHRFSDSTGLCVRAPAQPVDPTSLDPFLDLDGDGSSYNFV